MTSSKLEQINELLQLKLQAIEEEREHDVRDLQERITFLEKREVKLLEELDWWEEAMKKVKGGETHVAMIKENQRLREKLQEAELVLAEKERQLVEKETELTRLYNLSPSYLDMTYQQREMSQYQGYRNRDTRKKPVNIASASPSPSPPAMGLPHLSATPLEEGSRLPDTPLGEGSKLPDTPIHSMTSATGVGLQEGSRGFKFSWEAEQYTMANMVRGDTACNTVTGEIYFSCSRSAYIHSYRPEEGLWTRLHPPCPHLFFGMTLMQGRILAVGGQTGPEITAKVMTLVEDKGRCVWQEELPPMPTQRFNLTVVSFKEEKLLALGGLNHQGQVAAVELLHGDRQQWICVASLPRPADMLSSIVSSNQLYLLGATNTRSVYTCSIPRLLQTAPTQTGEVWFQLPDTPTHSPTGFVLDQQFFAVGGFDEKGVDSTAIWHFQEERRVWQVVSHMRTACNKPLLATLQHKHLMVVGGSTKVNDMMNVVQRATITRVKK